MRWHAYLSLLSRIIIDSPWYFFLLSLLAGAVPALWLYYRHRKNAEIPRSVVIAMALLRAAAMSLIAFLLLNILFRQLINETRQPLILLAVDNSSSMLAGDDSSAINNQLLPEIEDFRKKLGEKFTVRSLLFGDRVRSTQWPPDFRDKETDIAELLQEADNNYAGENVGAMIVLSDGIYNRGANPGAEAEKAGYPIYTVALGDTAVVKDLAIQKVNHNQVAYAGNNFPVEVVVSARQFSGRDVTVSLLQNGAEQARQNLRIGNEEFSGTCSFTLSARTPGFVRYSARVTVNEPEKNVLNNIQSFVIEVIDNREKILLLATSPHPDVSALENAILSNSSYQPEFALSNDFKKPLKAYSLVILHGQSQAQSAVVNECIANRIPLWIVNPRTYDNLPGMRIGGMINRWNDAEPVMAPGFGLFNLSEGLKKIVNDLPAVKTPFGNYALSNGANPLLLQRIGSVETENPVFWFYELSGHKTAVFAGDGLWRWSMRDFQENNNHEKFNELVSKTIQYLAVKSDRSFFRVNAPRLVNENESVEITAEVYNKSYELITDPDVSLTLSNSAGKKFNYTFGKSSGLYRLNAGMLAPGEYRYEARVRVKEELFVKQGLIVVKEVVSERINTVADHQLLWQLSNRSNGKMYHPSQLKELLNELLNSEKIKPVTYSQASTSPLIEMKLLFWIALLLLAAEWFFRKRWYSI